MKTFVMFGASEDRDLIEEIMFNSEFLEQASAVRQIPEGVSVNETGTSEEIAYFEKNPVISYFFNLEETSSIDQFPPSFLADRIGLFYDIGKMNMFAESVSRLLVSSLQEKKKIPIVQLFCDFRTMEFLESNEEVIGLSTKLLHQWIRQEYVRDLIQAYIEPHEMEEIEKQLNEQAGIIEILAGVFSEQNASYWAEFLGKLKTRIINIERAKNN